MSKSSRDSGPASAGETDADLQAVLDASPEGMIVDRDGQIVYANKPALRALGYRTDSALFWRPAVQLVHPNDRKRLDRALTGLGRSPARPELVELRMIRRTGQIVAIEATLLAITFAGEPSVLYMLRDVTERRRHEQQLQLADRMASVGTLAAGVAHELNSPLTYVLANIELAAERLVEATGRMPDELLEDVNGLLAEASEGAVRMKSILRDLRNFGRADEQKTVDVDVHQILDSVANMAMSEIRNRAHFVKEYGHILPVRANPNHLHQIFLNLLMNAAHAIPIGNVKDNEVRVATGLDGSRRVLVQVSDTGCGIDLDIMERIFDPFFTTKDQDRGTGLGLSICHGLVTALGGEIAVDSIVGEGTTFRVSLPPSSRTR